MNWRGMAGGSAFDFGKPAIAFGQGSPQLDHFLIEPVARLPAGVGW